MAKAKVQPVVESPVEQIAAPVQEQPQLTISDLQAVTQIIDLASRRGAFQAGELAQVGTAYNKLTVFLEYVASVQKPADEAAQ
jgi:hypothetical protein